MKKFDLIITIVSWSLCVICVVCAIVFAILGADIAYTILVSVYAAINCYYGCICYKLYKGQNL